MSVLYVSFYSAKNSFCSSFRGGYTSMACYRGWDKFSFQLFTHFYKFFHAYLRYENNFEMGIGMHEGWTLQKLDVFGFAEIPWKSVPFIILSLPRNVKKYFFTVSSYSWMNERDEKKVWMEKKENSSSLFYDYLSDKYDGSRE